MIVDSHLHADLSGYDPRYLVGYLDKHGIDSGWLLSWEESEPVIPDYHHLSPQRILEICAAYPGRFLPFYAPDPACPELENKLEWFTEMGFRGFGELKVSLEWDDPNLISYLERIRNIRPLLIFHMEKPGTMFSFARKSIENRVNFGFNGMPAYLLGIPRVPHGYGKTGRHPEPVP
jgi:predicted TIM-barrel fold metal-dependent hydrolase